MIVTNYCLSPPSTPRAYILHTVRLDNELLCTTKMQYIGIVSSPLAHGFANGRASPPSSSIDYGRIRMTVDDIVTQRSGYIFGPYKLNNLQ